MDDAFAPTSTRAAAARFARNRPALLALLALLAIAVFCALGPRIDPLGYDRSYPVYAGTAPSLAAHPSEAEASAALARVAARMHVTIEAVSLDRRGARATLTGARPIDERQIAYFERSDVFARPNVVARRDDGRTLVLDAPFEKVRMLAGADANGRDLMARMMVAARISLLVGVLGCAIAASIGVVWGAVAGYAGGRVDMAMMRIVDILYALPFLFFVILLVVVFGRRFVLIFVAIGAVEWLDMARIVRGQTLSLKNQEFVVAARALGVSSAGDPQPPHRPQSRRAGRGDAGAAGAESDPARKFPVLPGSRRSGAADEFGRVGRRRRPPHRKRALDADISRLAAVDDAARVQFPERGPLRRARPARALTCARRSCRCAGSKSPTGRGGSSPGSISTSAATKSWRWSASSGSGKTQAMLAALGLAAKSAFVRGSAKLDGFELIGAGERALNALRGAKATMIFQEPASALDPLYSIGAQIAAPMIAHKRADRAEARRRAARLLEQVGVAGGAGRLGAFPHELSGGERQRVMIAMAIANDPALIIADEPTTALDVTVEAQILDLIAALRRRLGAALVFISHDLRLVRRFADRVYVMREGSIVENGPSRQVLNRPKTNYARMLVAAEPAGAKTPAPLGGPVLISTRGLTVDYGGGFLARAPALRALEAVDFDLRQGRTLGVVGESGSGKSTLARALLRLVPSEGAILFEGRDIHAMNERALRPLRRRMQIVFQDPFGSLSPRMSVGAIVAEGLLAHEPGSSAVERDHRAAQALEQVGLDPAARFRTPDAFSGGQRQRIAIARALILRPSLVIFDEPTSSLDRLAQRAILELIAALQKSHGLTYILISHDLSLVRATADDVMVMRRGHVVERGRTADIFERPKEAYTRALVEAALRSDD